MTGAANDFYSSRAGTYILESNLVNGKAYWIQDTKSNALWYDKKYGFWLIGKIVDVGSLKARIYSPNDTLGPLEVTTWLYYSNHSWIESTDIAILPGMHWNLKHFKHT